MAVDDWERWIDGLRRGDEAVQAEFMRRFGPQLERVADRHLGGDMRRRIDPEDAVQSACRTFLRRATAGEFALPDSAALWRLLCAITVTKVREQSRFHLRKRRGVAHERHLDSVLEGKRADDSLPADEVAPEAAIEFADALAHVLGALGSEERTLVDLKLQGLPLEQICRHMNCSERTVQRLLQVVHAKIERMFAAGDD